jgi:hypothetical protein
VTTFELASWGDTQALAVYRDDPEGPGLTRPNVEAVLAAADGSLTRRTWELGETAGLPSVLIDPARPKGAPAGWLIVHGETEVRLGALSNDPLVAPELVNDLTLRSSEPAALFGGQLLRAKSRGTRVELDLVSCQLSMR